MAAFLYPDSTQIYEADNNILGALFEARIQRAKAGSSKHWIITFLKSIPGLIFLWSIVIAVKFILGSCLAIMAMTSPILCVALSAARLAQRDYGDADAANKAKLTAALDVFYALVLIYSLFVSYRLFSGNPLPTVVLVSRRCGFGNWGPTVVEVYYARTKAICSKDEKLPRGWNLITYSVGLLQSASRYERLRGSRVLDTFIEERIPVRQALLFSGQSIDNLIAMIVRRSTDDNSYREMRERAARILADLASELLVAQFPAALQCVCSLLESCDHYSQSRAHPSENSQHDRHQEDAGHLSLPIAEQDGHQQAVGLSSRELPVIETTIHEELFDRFWKLVGISVDYQNSGYRYSFVSKGTKELIYQGMVILERLTENQDNCIEISNHPRLLSKITSPLSCHDFLSNCYEYEHDNTWVEMLSRSLTVVTRLIVSPGDGAARLRHEIAQNTEAVTNLLGVLEVDGEGAQELHEQALEILTELASDDSCREQAFDVSTSMLQKFVKTLQRIFIEEKDGGTTVVATGDRERDNGLRRKAGEALARLLSIPSARGAIDALNSTTLANVAVDLLPKQDAIDLFTKVLGQILSSNTETAAGDGASNTSTEENIAESEPPEDADNTAENEEQTEERRLMAAMLSITVVICSKNVINEDDFAHAAPEDGSLVKKLKEMIVKHKDTTTNCVRIAKLTCQVVIAMIRLNPSCITDFNQHNLKEVLSDASNKMSELDNCMLFAGNDRAVAKPTRSLASLVKEAHGLLDRAQEQGNISA